MNEDQLDLVALERLEVLQELLKVKISILIFFS